MDLRSGEMDREKNDDAVTLYDRASWGAAVLRPYMVLLRF
jgi:hypothetical protein